jgi:hypothetical protein
VRFKSFCLALALAAGCTTVRTTTAPSANLAHFKTFAFRPTDQAFDRTPTGQTIRAQVTRDLEARGLRPAVNERPDVFVSYSMKMREVTAWGPYGYPGWWGWDGYGYADGYWVWDPYEYTQGTLTIDLTDTRTNEIFWRGTAVSSVAHPENPSDKRVSKAVDKMMGRLRL